MCTVLLPPCGYPIAVNKYIIYHTRRVTSTCLTLKIEAVWSFETSVTLYQTRRKISEHVILTLINLITSLKYVPHTNLSEFYIHGSVHRDSMLIRSNEMQQYAGVHLLQNYSTCFRCLSHPSSGVHQTVTAASGTGHSVRTIPSASVA